MITRKDRAKRKLQMTLTARAKAVP
jgi:hypothetical protein